MSILSLINLLAIPLSWGYEEKGWTKVGTVADVFSISGLSLKRDVFK